MPIKTQADYRAQAESFERYCAEIRRDPRKRDDASYQLVHDQHLAEASVCDVLGHRGDGSLESQREELMRLQKADSGGYGAYDRERFKEWVRSLAKSLLEDLPAEPPKAAN